MSSTNCPNCNAPINPAKYTCEYCGSYVIMDTGNGTNYSRDMFLSVSRPKNYKGIYMYGRLLNPEEYPVRTGMANLYRSMCNGAGGHLVLTNKSFMFCSHGLNLHFEPSEDEKDVFIDDIAFVEKKTVAFLSKRLIITLKNNQKRTFIVYGLDDWYEQALKALNGEFTPLPSFAQHITEYAEDSHQEQASSHQTNYIEELKQLKDLLDAGIITEEEFAIKKRALLKL